MASSRKPSRPKLPANLASRVEARVAEHVSAGDRLLVGLSGGVDSVVLLHVLAQAAARLQVRLEALHVNHQLSPHAQSWADFCRALCERIAVPCHVACVEVQRANSVERAAREARYGAFDAVVADHVVLAHNEDDQAETVLLNLLRGTGVSGLAAMPLSRLHKSARSESADSRPGNGERSIIRPLLDTPRSDIERYATEHALECIRDESNEDLHYTRNWVRHTVLPVLQARVPSAPRALARVARHMGEAARLLSDLAQIDAASAASADGFDADALRALGAERARNLLRHLIAQRGGRPPDVKRLAEALRQILHARADADPVVPLGDFALRRCGRLLYLLPLRAASASAATIYWSGEREIALPHERGVLTMLPGVGVGLGAVRLRAEPVTIRERRGGERMQPEAHRPRRSVKNLLQEARVPTWQRERLPFIYCGSQLACVAGVALDWRFRAAAGEPSIEPIWRDSQSA